MELNQIIRHDVKQPLPLSDKSVNCCITSPPYYGLRDYGVDGQFGLEETPEKFINTLVEAFRDVRRVLKDDGTIWVNIGDSYAGSGRGANENGKQGTNKGTIFNPDTSGKTFGLKPKDLIGIPWMLAFALRADGWYLRQDIIWHKPNPMPESVTDRCTKAHEYIFLLSKSQKYYYDAKSIATPYADKTFTTFGCEVKGGGDGTGLIQSENWANSIKVRKPKEWDKSMGGGGTSFNGHSGNFKADGAPIGDGLANKRSVWSISTKSYSEAHFATFPEDLIIDCIKAGCPEKGTVLDPFMGAGTTALVSAKLNRNFIGFELNEKYIKIAKKRLQNELGMFNPLRA